MANNPNPAAALRTAMRALLSMFRETLGDQAGASALKAAVGRALTEVTGASSKRRGKASKSSRKSAAKRAAKKPKAKSKAKSAAPKGRPASKGGKKKGKKKGKRKSGPPSPGRLRQIEAMKEYWRKQRAASAAGK